MLTAPSSESDNFVVLTIDGPPSAMDIAFPRNSGDIIASRIDRFLLLIVTAKFTFLSLATFYRGLGDVGVFLVNYSLTTR